MEIKRCGSRASGKGPGDWFTGTVRIDPLLDVPEPGRVAGASVTFEPGARDGVAYTSAGADVDRDGGMRVGAAMGWGAREEIRTGDVVWFSPGEKHWHGATATTAMVHIAIQEKLDGKAVDWMEKVSEEQYQTGDKVQMKESER